MEVKSLGYRTDLFFPRFEGAVIDRGEYLVIRTPSNPGFFWGNFLLFPQPPGPGDYDKWRGLFEEEISARQPTHHMVFGWDTTDGKVGEAEPFLAAGFELAPNVVLTADRVQRPAKYNTEVTIRPLTRESEWLESLENQVACRKPEHKEQGYREFKLAKLRRYQEMQRAGLGEWFGAFLGGRLVADLGLFCVDGVGRFQQVETLPEFRRQGICGALVYQAAVYGYEKMGAKKLVMIADENYHAARIYENIGFQPQEHQGGLEWWKK